MTCRLFYCSKVRFRCLLLLRHSPAVSAIEHSYRSRYEPQLVEMHFLGKSDIARKQLL